MMASKEKGAKAKVAKVKFAKVIASEMKWVCPVSGCGKSCKVRQLRSHLRTGHRWSGSLFACQILGCKWRCGMNMHCISNHSIKEHASIDNVLYELVEIIGDGDGLDQEGVHSLSCFSDISWHSSCIDKIQRKRKSKAVEAGAGDAGVQIITKEENEEAVRVGLK